MRRFVAGVTILVAVAAASDGLAQTPARPGPLRDIAVSASAGVATELEDYPRGSMKWLGSVRFGLTPHLAIEAEAGRWSLSDYQDYVNDYSWYGGFTATLGTVRRTWSSELEQWQAGVSLVGRSTGRHVSVFGGGGIGVWFEQSRLTGSEQRLGVPSPVTNYEDHWSRTAIGTQGFFGVDVALGRRIALFGEGRLELVPTLDTTLFSAYAGVRVRF
jgi:hypothetical protein